MSKPRRGGQGFLGRVDTSQLRITRGALILLFLQVGLSLVWLLSDVDVRASLSAALETSTDQVWRDGKAWTLVTAPFLETRFISLVFQALILWWFVPTLERWWGIKRFFVFFAVTSLAGTLAATAFGLVTGGPGQVTGYDPFIYASIVAFGILYGRQQVQFFGVIPLTGRQLMYGIIGFVTLFVVLGQQWELGVGYASAMVLSALMTSGKWNPKLWLYQWRHRRVRRKLEVLDGGRAKPRRGKDERYLN